MFFVYIVTDQRNGTLYIGHTDSLGRRIPEHVSGTLPGYASTHNCTRLVWFEWHETRDSAFQRERQMKEWKRAWKIRRIEKLNPYWDDLYPGLTEDMVYDEKRQFHPDYL